MVSAEPAAADVAAACLLFFSGAAFSAACIARKNNNNNLQAFQLIVLARYLLAVPNPSPVSQHASQQMTYQLCIEACMQCMRHTLDEHIRGPMSAMLWARIHACGDHAQHCKRLSMSLIKHKHL